MKRKIGNDIFIPKLLIKIAKNNHSDPPSYEYYIGLTMNKLRSLYKNEEIIDNFALIYGRFNCSIDNIKNNKLCIGNENNSKTHICYEYIRNVHSNKITTSFLNYFNNLILFIFFHNFLRTSKYFFKNILL